MFNIVSIRTPRFRPPITTAIAITTARMARTSRLPLPITITITIAIAVTTARIVFHNIAHLLCQQFLIHKRH